MGFSRQEHWSGLPFPSLKRTIERKWSQSCPTLCDPMDCSLPSSPIHGIFQAKVLEWIAIAFSKLGLGVNIYTLVHKCSVMSESLWPYGLQPTRLYCPWNFPAKNIGASCHFPLHRIFLTPGLNLSPAFGTQILYHCATGEAHYTLLHIKETPRT